MAIAPCALIPGRLAIGLFALGMLAITLQGRAASVGPESRPAPAADLYGDPLPEGALARLGTVRFRSETGTTVRFFPGGKSLLVGGYGSVGIMDRESGKERTVKLTADNVFVQTVSADCRIAATVMANRLGPRREIIAIRVWEISTGKLLRSIEYADPKNSVFTLALSPDGKRLAAGGHNPFVRVFDTTTGEELWKVAPSDERYAAGHQPLMFSPDGSMLLGPDEKQQALCFYDAATGKQLRELCKCTPAGGAAFSSDGKTVATILRRAVNDRARVHLWETASGKELPTPEDQPGNAFSVALSPDGKTVATSSGSSQRQVFWGPMDIGLWDVATGKKQHQFPGGWNLAFSSDGATLASCFGNPVMLHDVATGKELSTEFIGHRSVIWSLVFSADGKTLTSEDRQEVKHVWDVASGKEIDHGASRPTRGNVWAYSPNGKFQAWMQSDWDGIVHVEDVAAGKELYVIKVDSKKVTGPLLAFSPDGKVLAGASFNRPSTICLWETETGKELPLARQPAGNGCTRISYSPDGKFLALGGHDQALRLWEIATGREYRVLGDERAPSGYTTAIAFSRDGKTVAASIDDKTHVWEVGSGKERAVFPMNASSLCFSRDGLMLAAGVNTTVLLWDVTGTKRPGQEAKPVPIATLWADLGSEEPARAYRAFGLLTTAPKSVAYLRERLKPVVVDEEKTARWIADLENDGFEVRERASQELEKLAELAEPALRKKLTQKPTLELQRRVEDLLERLERPVLTGEALQTWRALEVLESIGTPEARPVLEIMARGAEGSRLTKEARAALDRFDR